MTNNVDAAAVLRVKLFYRKRTTPAHRCGRSNQDVKTQGWTRLFLCFGYKLHYFNNIIIIEPVKTN